MIFWSLIFLLLFVLGSAAIAEPYITLSHFAITFYFITFLSFTYLDFCCTKKVKMLRENGNFVVLIRCFKKLIRDFVPYFITVICVLFLIFFFILDPAHATTFSQDFLSYLQDIVLTNTQKLDSIKIAFEKGQITQEQALKNIREIVTSGKAEIKNMSEKSTLVEKYVQQGTLKEHVLTADKQISEKATEIKRFVKPLRSWEPEDPNMRIVLGIGITAVGTGLIAAGVMLLVKGLRWFFGL
jgi:hypothetical protein